MSSNWLHVIPLPKGKYVLTKTYLQISITTAYISQVFNFDCASVILEYCCEMRYFIGPIS
jgi:hypothetical protein